MFCHWYYNICTSNSDGTGILQLTDFKSLGVTGADALAWSPDWTKIVFTYRQSRGMLTIDADGSNLTRLTTFGRDPDWAYVIDRIGLTSGNLDYGNIFTMLPDATDVVQLTHEDQWSMRRPDWSPPLPEP
jgi:Tol biopolymer transport system component